MRALALLLLLPGLALAGVPKLDPRQPAAFHAAARPPAKVAWAGTSVEVPLEPGRLPVVLATVNGQGPFRLGIETGSPVALVTPALAARLGLPAAGGDAEVPAYAIERISIGGATFEGLVVAGLQFAAPDIDGVLGLSVFEDVLLTVDGPARLARLERGALPGRGPGVVAIQRQGPFVGVPVRFGPKEHVAIVDTRASSDLLVLPEMAGALPLASAPVEVGRARGPAIPETAVRAARLEGDVTFAGVTVQRPILSVHAVPPPIPQRPILGSGVLMKLAFTLDQRTERIRFTAPGPIAPAPPIRTLGFGLRPRPGAAPLVAAVTPGSGAEKAGVREGDEVVSVAGVPGGQLDPGKLRELTRAQGPLAVRLGREGAEREVAVEPVTLVP